MGGLPRDKRSALTHFDRGGRVHMVEVGAKPETERVAVASARITCARDTALRIAGGRIGKGDVLGTARLAAISGLKRTSELIPLCHPLRVTGVAVELKTVTGGRSPGVEIAVTVRAFDRTGVEMEALTGAAVAALTIYDMCKAIDRGMAIGPIRLEEKRGGASGHWVAQRRPPRRAV